MTEFMAGGSLQKAMDQDTKGSYAWRGLGRNIMLDTAKGLCYLHTLPTPVAHFDLKPDNILLTGDNPPRAKLCDVGLSKALTAGEFVKSPGYTRGYKAPELKNGDGDFTGLQWKTPKKGGAVNVHIPSGTVHIAGRKEVKMNVLKLVRASTKIS